MSTPDPLRTEDVLPKSCGWDQNSDGDWETECGEIFSIIEGSPADNEMRFCCYCGKKLAQCSYVDPDDEEDDEEDDDE